MISCSRTLAVTAALMALAATSLLAPAPAARAGDSWTRPFPGVRRLVRTTSAPLKVYALEIDLCHQGILVRATKPSEKGVTAGAYAQARAAEMAINGDLFGAGFATTGMAVGAGTWWGNADNSTQGFIAFGTDQIVVKKPSGTLARPEAWMRDVVGGRPKLVEGGANFAFNANAGPACTSRAPRTAVGVSEDGRTLWLVVVDRVPRSTGSVSRGMTCAELQGLMRGLGAYEALNLDGGGSSQMWVKGLGYVNDPSGNAGGGGVRAVANHIAIQAGGNAAPNSCVPLTDPGPPQPPAGTVRPIVPEATGSTDIDGDGIADACMRGPGGLSCVLGAPGGFGAEIAGPALSDAQGWGDATNGMAILMGDIDGDGRADVCARANAGIRCWKSRGDGFGAAIVGPAFSDAQGFADPSMYTTMRMADVDGDGRADVCMRTRAAFRCDKSTGDGFEGTLTASGISDANGFTAESEYGTIRMGDVDGDGRDDVCARTPAGMRCWRSLGDSFAAGFAGPAWSNANGWGAEKYWRTIRLADVDGDGRADLCARTASDYRCHLSTGAGFGDAVIGPALSNANGWDDPANYETLQLGDIDGDGDLDLCGRAVAGVRCWPWTGTRHALGSRTTELMPDANGWGQERFYATMRLVDIDGDGKADLCARSSAGLLCYRATGGATPFSTAMVGPRWSDATGYNVVTAYGTLMATRSTPAVEEEPGPVVEEDPVPDEGPVAEEIGAETIDVAEVVEDVGGGDTFVGEDDTWVAPDVIGDTVVAPDTEAPVDTKLVWDTVGREDTEAPGDAAAGGDTEPVTDAMLPGDTATPPDAGGSDTAAADTTRQPPTDAVSQGDAALSDALAGADGADGTFVTSTTVDRRRADDGCTGGGTPASLLLSLAAVALLLTRRRRAGRAI